VIKHLPLPGHKQARPAAIAAMAAHRQGKFWEMHEMLFSNQERLDAASIAGYARHLGLDAARFEADLADPAIAAAIDADADEAIAKGFRGVPAFTVNGRVVLGARPLDDMRAIVDEELARVRGRK
jgi:protein-disulfide isomerase